MFPWKTGYGTLDYGKATVYNWETLMNKIEEVRKECKDAKKVRKERKDADEKSKDAEQELDKTEEEDEDEEMTEKESEHEKTAAEKLRRKRWKFRRKRCLAWLLNSMARNMSFNKKRAKLLNRWRFEFARNVEAGKQTRIETMDIEVREAVNTLALKSITENNLPRAWHKTEERLQQLQVDLGKMYHCQTSEERKVKTPPYQRMPGHRATQWIDKQLEKLKKPLPLEEEKTDHASVRLPDLESRLDNIINGDGTKGREKLDKTQARVVRETFALAKIPEQFFVLVDGGPGTGKTKTTARLAEALKLLDMTTAYTGSTGTVATNFRADFGRGMIDPMCGSTLTVIR